MPSTFTEVHAAHAVEIERYCRRMVHHVQTAEDLTQETFLNAWQAFEAFDGANPRGWLYCIARNVCLKHLGKAKLDISLDVEDQEPQQIAQRDWPLELVVIAVSADKLIAAMPAEQRETVMLRISGCTLQEISQSMGKVAVSTVASRLYHAQAYLGSALG